MVSVRKARVSLLLLLCCVLAWLSYSRLHHHVQLLEHHVGFNLLHEDAPPPPTPRLRDVYQPGFRQPSSRLCPNNGQNVDLLILTTSTPVNAEHRMAIRHTWGQYHGRRRIVVGFMLGVQSDPEVDRLVAEETELHGDVIVNNNVDSYYNLTLKTAAIFEWTRTYCPLVARLLKADDDMFINVPRLMAYTRALPLGGPDRLIYGRLREDVRPERYARSKYFVSTRAYRPHVYPTFVTGCVYLTTPDVAMDLLRAALDLAYLSLEDVFFTGVVAQRVGVTRVAAPEITNMDYYFRRNACLVHQGITWSVGGVDEQYRLWDYLLDKRRWCVDKTDFL